MEMLANIIGQVIVHICTLTFIALIVIISEHISNNKQIKQNE